LRRIESIDVFPVLLPVIETFQFASGSAGTAGGTAPHVFVKVTDTEGEVGWGEGRPVPQWSYETLQTVETTIRDHLAPALLGLPVTDRWGLHHRMQAAIGRGPSTGQPIAKAALDLAVHDLCARAAGMSLRTFLGGDDGRAAVELSYTLTGQNVTVVREEVAAAREVGFRHFNFKVALASGDDPEVAGAVREAAGHEPFVWADANQGYNLHQAREVAPRLAAAGVDVLEQPLPADRMHLMRELRKSVQMPLAVDESSVSPADFFAHAAEGLVDYLVVKVTRSGGAWPTLTQISVAEAAGLPLLVSGLTDGLLTKVAVCQIAAAFGCAGPAALNGSQFTDESALFPTKAKVESEGTVHLPTGAGIGVRPDEEAMRDFLADDRGAGG
jgi:L-alanine-DL-glutamate epimerase-like enolase superfamily enzyme